MRLWWGVAVCAATTVAGCGDTAAPSLLRGEPAGYLLTVDQLVSPDFTVDIAPHQLGVTDIAGRDAAVAKQLGSAGFLAGAAEEFFRAAASLAEANGPIQVRDAVEEFSSTSGAGVIYAADTARLDAVAGATAISTGALGNEAHATTRNATASSGTMAVEITVEWRVGNLVDVIVVRGRAGGTRLDDALLLAHRQTVAELGLSTARASRAATATPSAG
ncbi:MAG: hypothetical protein M3Z57_08405 [Candidatus Dormibacteraeota bacterium]|nr:hypothetical protein [Candidatus Dormibacteraeota bacterium]